MIGAGEAWITPLIVISPLESKVTAPPLLKSPVRLAIPVKKPPCVGDTWIFPDKLKLGWYWFVNTIFPTTGLLKKSANTIVPTLISALVGFWLNVGKSPKLGLKILLELFGLNGK